MQIKLKDFFHYYEGTAEQQTAVEMLEAAMPPSLLMDVSPWVKQYRAKPPSADMACHETRAGTDHGVLGGSCLTP